MDQPLELTFLGTTSQGGHCPTMFATNRNTYVVQGKVVTDPGALTTVNGTYAGLGPDETLVEIPADLLRYAPGA
jgi:hypothetical protein